MAKKKTASKKKPAAKPKKKTSTSPAKKPAVRHVMAELLHPDEEIPPIRNPEVAEDDHQPVDDELVADGVDSDIAAADEDRDSENRDADSEDSGGRRGRVSSKGSRLPVKAGSRALAKTVDPIAQYLAEVRKYPLLSREEEQALAKKYYETKDPVAAQALVTANLRFVVKIAAEYSKFGARLIDLVQEGNMGLMHAVRDFNPYKNVRLITYAVWWIRGYIQEYLMKQYSLVKIGTTQNQKKLFYRLQKEKDALDALGENPDMALIGTKLGIPQEEVQEMAQRLRGRDLSLSQTVDDDSKSSLMDFQKSNEEKPDDQLMHQEELQLLRERIEDLRPELSERESMLLDERLLADEPLTLQEIGEKYGITREAVRQMEVRLMDKIRKSLVDAD